MYILIEKRYHDELKMELEGAQCSGAASNQERKTISQDAEPGDESVAPDVQQVVEDSDNLSMVVMSRKKRQLYEAMKVNILFF